MIFTSTPQGLEPGRTGFCTVARHRSLRSRLVRELERLSVYDFNLGEGATKAEINSFRRFELGTEEFYVLTRIRDAGLDYTNRTNYIAHHLIFDGLEIAVSPSPPEIFLQWNGWLDFWEGSSRWIEDDEITDVSACKMSGLSPAQNWQAITGDGGNAAYLVAEKAKHPILLENHPGQEGNLLHLFAESSALVAMPMDAWQFAFTTYLQETDNAKDYAWIGGCGQPASLRLKQNGVPNHLDFTAFEQSAVRDPMDEKQVFVARNGRKAAIKKTPPPPPVGEGAEAGSSAGEFGESTRISEGRSGSGGFSRTEKEQFRQAAASHAAAQSTATAQSGGEAGRKKKKPAKWPWISALAAVMLLAVFIVLKSGVLDVLKDDPVDPNPIAENSGKAKDNGGDLDADPEANNPNGTAEFVQAGVASLAKVTAKDERLNTWIEFTVGESPPARIDVSAMSNDDYDRFGDRLRDLKVGQEMAVTFRNGKQPGTFLLESLAAPSTLALAGTDGTDSTAPNNPPRLPSTPLSRKLEFAASDIDVVEDNFMLSFVSPQGVQLKYVFPPERRARFEELREYLAAGRKVTFIWNEDQGHVREFDFSVEAAVIAPPTPTPVLTTAPPPFPVVGSHVLWLTKGEVEDPQLESVSAQGDAAFVQTLKTALSRIADSKTAFVWETDYAGAQALVDTPLMEGAQRYVAIYDARVKELLGIERYSLETPQEEGSTLFLRFLFKSSSEVSVIFENQRARNAASRGVVLRLPDPQTNRSIDLYLLSPRVVGNKPNELPKAYLAMTGNRVSLAKKGAFGHGLRVVGSTGPRLLKLSVNPSARVFYGASLSPKDFTNRRLLDFPNLLVKPVAEDSLTCELALFIDYMTDLRKKFQEQISSLNQKTTGEQAAKMPLPKIYQALEQFGSRAGSSKGNYKAGSGVGSFGPHVIDAVLDFFRKIHGYSPAALDKLRSDLTLDPRKFYLNDLEYREFWRKVAMRAKEEAFRPFGLGYDPKNLSRDIDRVIGTLRFLREAERAFGVNDQGIGTMIFAVVREIIEPNTGAVKKLYDQLIAHKATPEARVATPRYTQEWNRYLQDFAEVHAPAELTSAELRKGITCIENPDLVKMYKEHLFDRGTTTRQLGPLKQWFALLQTEISKKDPRLVPQEYEPARKLRLMNSYFHSEEWSLRLFRQGQLQPEAELIHFK